MAESKIILFIGAVAFCLSAVVAQNRAALPSVGAADSCPSSNPDFDNELEVKAGVTLYWTVLSDEEVIFGMTNANEETWLGLGESQNGCMDGAAVIVGSDSGITEHRNLVMGPEALSNPIVGEVSFSDGEFVGGRSNSMMHFTKNVETRGPTESMIWAVGQSLAPSYHGSENHGAFVLNLSTCEYVVVECNEDDGDHDHADHDH